MNNQAMRRVFKTMTKTPREILICSDSDNMCLTCAIGILNNPSEEFKSNFEMDCRRGGLSFEDISMRFFQNHSWKTPSRLNEEAYVYLENAHKYSGSTRMRYRCRMYHKPQGWELENGLRNQYYEMWKKGN